MLAYSAYDDDRHEHTAPPVPESEVFQLTGHDAAGYGDALGGDYDALYPEAGLDTEAAVALLADLALCRPERSVLEFGIGTGRLAFRLQRLGLRVAGIDASERMVATLRSKSHGKDVDLEVGDYATTRVEGVFSVVAIVFNSILDPRGRSAQLNLFGNAARHLGDGGYFVVESLVLSDAQRSGEWWVSPRYVGKEHVELQLARYDIATNQIERTLVHLRPGGLNFIEVTDTYAGPNELDIMAEVTGFVLHARTAGWSGEVFTSTSTKHVSVYRLARRVNVSVQGVGRLGRGEQGRDRLAVEGLLNVWGGWRPVGLIELAVL